VEITTPTNPVATAKKWRARRACRNGGDKPGRGGPHPRLGIPGWVVLARTVSLPPVWMDAKLFVIRFLKKNYV